MQNSSAPNRPVTREMVYSRTIELASLAGRASYEIRQHDYEQAKRELTGESDFDKQQAIFDFNEYC
jgi:methyl coenzyme M reductase gamma subunit